jgi:SMC interacting uncharacterized protein involved in chromosome segregation
LQSVLEAEAARADIMEEQRALISQEIELRMEQFRAEFLQLLTREVELRERKIKALEAEIDQLKRHLALLRVPK